MRSQAGGHRSLVVRAAEDFGTAVARLKAGDVRASRDFAVRAAMKLMEADTARQQLLAKANRAIQRLAEGGKERANA